MAAKAVLKGFYGFIFEIINTQHKALSEAYDDLWSLNYNGLLLSVGVITLIMTNQVPFLIFSLRVQLAQLQSDYLMMERTV